MEIFASQRSCCCGPASCRLCCSRLTPINESTSTRLMYTLFLTLTFIIQCVMQVPTVKDLVQKNTINISDTCLGFSADRKCFDVVGYAGVYKVGFAVSVFHFTLMLLTINVSSSDSARAHIHNGYWLYKFAILCVLILGALFIPTNIILIWSFAGMLGSYIVTVKQMLGIVKKCNFISEICKQVARNEQNCIKKAVPKLMCTALSLLTVAGVVLLFYFYGSSFCLFPLMFLIVHTMLFFWLADATFKRRKCTNKNPNLGLIKTPAICLYIVYLMWSAISSCHAGLSSITNFDSPPRGAEPQITIKLQCKQPVADGGQMIPPIIGVVLLFIDKISDSISDESSSILDKIRHVWTLTRQRRCLCFLIERDIPIEPRGQKVIENEAIKVTYSYACYHFTCCSAALYLMMQLTNWFSPFDSSLENYDERCSSFFIKTMSIWFCLFAVKPWPCECKIRERLRGLWTNGAQVNQPGVE